MLSSRACLMFLKCLFDIYFANNLHRLFKFIFARVDGSGAEAETTAAMFAPKSKGAEAAKAPHARIVAGQAVQHKIVDDSIIYFV